MAEYNCQLTDVDPDAVAIGDELEMTFRKMYTAEGSAQLFLEGTAEPLALSLEGAPVACPGATPSGSEEKSKMSSNWNS